MGKIRELADKDGLNDNKGTNSEQPLRRDVAAQLAAYKCPRKIQFVQLFENVLLNDDNLMLSIVP